MQNAHTHALFNYNIKIRFPDTPSKNGGRNMATSIKTRSRSGMRGVIRYVHAKAANFPTTFLNEIVSDYGKDVMKKR